jgi:hypothetical protein
MLVITGNWAFTDGSLWQPPVGRHACWLPAIHRAALRHGFGRDGIYRPIDAIDIVFAGDTFDCLASRRWTGTLKPWHGGPATRAARAAVLVAAGRRGRHLFASLSRWSRHGLPVPGADRRGRPQRQLGQRADVRVTLLAGDRDRWIDEAGVVAGRHGHAVGRLWATTHLVVHHGAELDPIWSSGELDAEGSGHDGDRPPLLGESLAVDLVARFAAAIGDLVPARPALRKLLATLGTARTSDLPAVLERWLAAAQGGRSLPATARDMIRGTWKRSLADWHREAIRHPPVCGLEACPVDALATWLEMGAAAPARVVATVAALQPRIGLATRRPPRVAPGPPCSDSVITVLGHAALPDSTGGAAADRIVCLGGPESRTLVGGREAAPVWEPLEADAAEAAVIGLGTAASDRSGDTVVDAIIAAVGRSAAVGNAA